MSTYLKENGVEIWRDDEGEFHREDGPAILHPSRLEYWVRHGKIHRVDGPAVVYSDNMQYWYIDNTCFPGFDRWLEALDAADAEKVLLKMQYA